MLVLAAIVLMNTCHHWKLLLLLSLRLSTIVELLMGLTTCLAVTRLLYLLHVTSGMMMSRLMTLSLGVISLLERCFGTLRLVLGMLLLLLHCQDRVQQWIRIAGRWGRSKIIVILSLATSSLITIACVVHLVWICIGDDIVVVHLSNLYLSDRAVWSVLHLGGLGSACAWSMVLMVEGLVVMITGFLGVLLLVSFTWKSWVCDRAWCLMTTNVVSPTAIHLLLQLLLLQVRWLLFWVMVMTGANVACGVLLMIKSVFFSIHKHLVQVLRLVETCRIVNCCL